MKLYMDAQYVKEIRVERLSPMVASQVPLGHSGPRGVCLQTYLEHEVDMFDVSQGSDEVFGGQSPGFVFFGFLAVSLVISEFLCTNCLLLI